MNGSITGPWQAFLGSRLMNAPSPNHDLDGAEHLDNRIAYGEVAPADRRRHFGHLPTTQPVGSSRYSPGFNVASSACERIGRPCLTRVLMISSKS